MIAWTGEDKPPQRNSETKNTSKPPPGGWPMGYSVSQVKAAIQEKNARLLRSSGVSLKK